MVKYHFCLPVLICRLLTALNNFIGPVVKFGFMNRSFFYPLSFLIVLISNSTAVLAQKGTYIDGRPSTSQRILCVDEGIVLSHDNGPDSCDTYGAREAIVNKIGDTYYLFYDGAGKDGWLACLAESKDLKNWVKKGAILTLGDSSKADSKSASAPWVIKEKGEWHMFYLGTPHTTSAPDRIPAFPYLTMKAKSKSLEGPWIKQYNVKPFLEKKNSFYTVTASPGFIVKYKSQFLQFFSGATQDSTGTKRTLGLAKTNNLNNFWKINDKPVLPLTEQVENSSLFFDARNKTWYLFTNHIGINTDGTEYTDAIWVYWSKNLEHWKSRNKAIVLDGKNCSWSKGAIGMPTVIKVGNKLAMLYDAAAGNSISHMHRDIGLAWISLPIKIKN
ncbi:Glycosyl hydrolases family 43 [Mucilaginibacter lappiensis]|uniref:GH43/DUF377 family glycosyl hydrolase n=1 Tax=Mucilaginibacter lappiensis TaxID=354630 RepID=A0ABR6PD24_9SPHI|nr:hypothetical protein [Mucilaginibacter lappiensis]MBB6107649.1 putative GH43/DUF377 family glycosyl hydrolase [Mucilaginibacter lappiensis]SIQ01721.1 Glycosyl hydrolases family 43 [Mucilaginibacter lappiensis]